MSGLGSPLRTAIAMLEIMTLTSAAKVVEATKNVAAIVSEKYPKARIALSKSDLDYFLPGLGFGAAACAFSPPAL